LDASGVGFQAGNTSTFSLTGTAAADTLTGAGSADTLTGAAAADIMDGGAGADVFLIADPDHHATGETIAGGAGADTIRFTSTTATDTLTLLVGVTDADNAITVEISNAAGANTGTTALNVNADALVDTLAVTLIGNDGANVLVGNASADTISGGGGADTITGGSGADTIDGEAAADTIVYTVNTDGAALVTLTDITGADDDFDATAGTDTDDIQFVIADDSIKIDGALEASLEAAAARDISSTTANLDYDAVGVFLIAAAQANLDADDFGDVSDLATNFNIGNGTVANNTAGDEILFTIENASGDETGLYYFKDVDGDGNMSDGDIIALLGIIADDTLTAADIIV
jgi:hypothetical protein